MCYFKGCGGWNFVWLIDGFVCVCVVYMLCELDWYWRYQVDVLTHQWMTCWHLWNFLSQPTTSHQTKDMFETKKSKNMFHWIHFSTSQNHPTAARKYPGIGVWFCQQHATLRGCLGVQYLCPPTGGVVAVVAACPATFAKLQKSSGPGVQSESGHYNCQRDPWLISSKWLQVNLKKENYLTWWIHEWGGSMKLWNCSPEECCLGACQGKCWIDETFRALFDVDVWWHLLPMCWFLHWNRFLAIAI